MTALQVTKPRGISGSKDLGSPMTSADSPTRVDDVRAVEPKAWKHKLRHSDNQAPAPVDAKKHRFSLRRLFKHEHHDKKGFVPPVPIPTDFLTREKHGGVTVSGRRVPFTRDAHKKRRRKAVKPMPRINEDRSLTPVATSKSMEEYRRRAYYPAKKAKSPKKK